MKIIKFIPLLVLVLFNLLFFVSTSRYLIKKKPKVPDMHEFAVPQVPEMAYDVYPGIEWHTLDQKYNEMVSGEDLAQIETMVGKVLPQNAALVAKLTPSLVSNAYKIKDR